MASKWSADSRPFRTCQDNYKATNEELDSPVNKTTKRSKKNHSKKVKRETTEKKGFASLDEMKEFFCFY